MKQHRLGTYGELQAVIAQFQESFSERTYAGRNGWNARAALDPTWADLAACRIGELLLGSELRTTIPVQQ